MILIVSGAGPSGHSAGSPINEGLRELSCLWNRCDRPRTTPGLPACAVLAVQRHALLWQQQAGFRVFQAPWHRRGRLSPDNVWYCKVLLLFTIQAQTDINGSTADFECAFVSVMETMKPRDGDNLSDLRERGLRVIYEIDPKVL